jgi:hypothetical protein
MRTTKDETGSLCSLGKGDEVEVGEVDDGDRPAMGDRATVVATMVAMEDSGAIFVADSPPGACAPRRMKLARFVRLVGGRVGVEEVDDRDRPAMGDRATLVATMVAVEDSGAIFIADSPPGAMRTTRMKMARFGRHGFESCCLGIDSLALIAFRAKRPESAVPATTSGLSS